MTYHLDIDSYIGYPISKGYVRAKLEPLKGKPCAVRINSFGGSVADALDIRQQFIDHGDVTAYIFGMTASAATILAMGAKRIVMSRYAVMLIHRCSGWVDTWGQLNAEELETAIKELRQTQTDLETLDGVVVNLYAMRTGRKPEDMAAVMAEARWLTAEECKSLGLIDEIIEEGEQTAVTAQMREHFAACGMPLPEVKEEKPGLVQRVVSGIKAILSPDGETEAEDEETETYKTNTSTIMDKTLFGAILAALGVESLTANADGSATLSAAQLTAINDALAAAKADVMAQKAETDRLAGELATANAAAAALQEQVENLQKADGDTTTDIEDGGADEEARATAADKMFKATVGLV